MTADSRRLLIRSACAEESSAGTPVRVFSSSAAASAAVAADIAKLIRQKAAAGESCVLGLATGSTPTGVYDELVRLHRSEGLSFRNVVCFNLDEFWPMPPERLQSFRRFMQEYLFEHVDIDPGCAHIPDGTLPRERIAEFCAAYERRIRAAGGIELQLLGIGRSGHIGFNEPGSRRDSRTRLVTLDKVTRLDAASDFFGEWNVPRQALTMGVGTILEARRIVLLAFGEAKARIVREALEGPVTASVAASYLQRHASAEFVLDPAAAGELTPVKTPWLAGPLRESELQWDATLVRRAVIWLAQQCGKPILKLIEEDYNEHGLEELLSVRGSAYAINIEVFKSLQNTITGWPGGKPPGPATGDAGRIRHASTEFPKRVLVFSPHPDDDVISMGGTLIRLCQQGHEVHVAYQTSGNIAVFDDEAIRFADFVSELAQSVGLAGAEFERLEQQARQYVRQKAPGECDSPELARIKSLIRRTEARAAASFCGVAIQRLHFLDLPFYETGRVKKRPLSEKDVAIVRELLARVRPHQIYAAGDLSDPHGTHRVCLRAILSAVEALRAEAAGGADAPAAPASGAVHGRANDAAWINACDVWLYRGAWQEWEPERIEMAVPLSPDEVEKKRLAIFKHQSQKDKALFPGPWDSREFWQRAEDRNRETALQYDRLGLPEYQAIEAFVRWSAE